MSRPTRILSLLLGVSILLCAVWCIMTLHEPGRLIFLPGGDVGLGFRSFAGRLEWIEYAPWDREHMDFAWWSLPWWVPIGGQALLLAWLILRGRTRKPT